MKYILALINGIHMKLRATHRKIPEIETLSDNFESFKQIGTQDLNGDLSANGDLEEELEKLTKLVMITEEEVKQKLSICKTLQQIFSDIGYPECQCFAWLLVLPSFFT